MFPKKTSYGFAILFWAVTTLTALCLSFYVLPIYIMDRSIYDVKFASADVTVPIRVLSSTSVQSFSDSTTSASIQAISDSTTTTTSVQSTTSSTTSNSVQAVEMCSGGCMGLDVATIQIIGGICSSLCAAENTLTSSDCSCGSCCKSVTI
jgi:hypothetical protein